jgi:hypothetical protein
MFGKRYQLDTCRSMYVAAIPVYGGGSTTDDHLVFSSIYKGSEMRTIIVSISESRMIFARLRDSPSK